VILSINSMGKITTVSVAIDTQVIKMMVLEGGRE
jgi:hypothetical protein